LITPKSSSRSLLALLLAVLPVLPSGVLVALPSLDFITGKALFEKQWVFAPASTAASDGLGPYFNARSCSGCHAGGGRGTLENRVVHTDDVELGLQLQKFTRPGVAPEAGYALAWHVNEKGLRRPHVSMKDPGRADQFAHSVRLAPSLAGLGQLAAIPEAQLLLHADANDADGDGISGRVNRLADGRIGRFGWKASQPGLREQTALALSQDLGLGNPVHPSPWGDCTELQLQCLAAPHGNSDSQDGLEVSEQVLHYLTTYVAELPAPPEPVNQDRGKDVFSQVGCAACHVTSFALDQGELAPYTDMLLHDMGPGLADELAAGTATGREWRTAPLWGLGKVSKDSGYLHDGRAASVHEAVLWHGGEGSSARAAYLQLNELQRSDLIHFLNGL